MRVYSYNSFLSVEIETDGGSNIVTVVSKIHVNKRNKMPTTFSTEFTDREIMRSSEFLTFVARFV